MTTLLADGELLVLPALALAAGLDLYLTLWFLGVAAACQLWPAPPGALGDLASPGVVIPTGLLWLAELLAERRFGASLVWSVFHAAVQPLAGALLVLLLLDGRSTDVLLWACLAVAAATSLAYATASGQNLFLHLDTDRPVRPVLARLLEDAAVLGLLVLALERPVWSAGAAALVVLGSLPWVPSRLRIFRFAIRLAWGRLRRLGGGGVWTPPDDFPRWLRKVLAREAVVPGGLRGTPGAVLRAPRARTFVRGWLVVLEARPVFIHGKTPGARVDLASWTLRTLSDEGWLRRVALRTPAHSGEPADGAPPPHLLLVPNGPSFATLEVELDRPEPPNPDEGRGTAL